ncbi:MAG: glycosyl hydrolase 115 family protein [Tannerellaceae bacterium]|jgi:hypothetical protein|nr:glycosyl hydrolase 115 family protein [Tannerellaceae bacterium]
MRKNVFLLAMLATCGALSAQNPFIRDQFSADPTARVFEGRVYVYPSHDIPSPIERLKEWFCMADYHVFSSENLTEWTDHGVIVSQDKVPWVDSESYTMWAPDCVFRNGKYYFYFPASVKDTLTGRGSMVGVAVADRPEGPYVPRPEPIRGIHGIDPCTLIDRDGRAYIYWAGYGNLMGAQLQDNMLELASEPVVIRELPPPDKGLKEGPFVFERNGRYYFTFPWVQDSTESLVYAMGDHPLGPFEMKGVIMDQSPTGCWTNHHSIIEYRDQWYLFYHHNDLSPGFDKNRSVRVDSLFFLPDGSIRKVIPTLRGVGITDARKEIHPDRYSNLSNRGAGIDFLNPNNTFEGWKTILSSPGAWVQYNRVDFGNKDRGTLETLEARLASPKGGTLKVRRGSANGKVIAEIQAPRSQAWTHVTVALQDIPFGIGDLFVTLEDRGPVEIDWIRFHPGVKAGPTDLPAPGQFVFAERENPSWFPLATDGQPVAVLFDASDHKGVLRAVNDLRDDLYKVTGTTTPQGNTPFAVIVGTAGHSAGIDRLLDEGKINARELTGKREKYIIQTVENPIEGIRTALVIAGSDKRGTIYGLYELSRQIGVSPWYWWADVPVERQRDLYVKPGIYTDGEPAVTYRGIFINDEAPAFQGWCREKFGGVNSRMYEKMFELILRLKGNFLWPAMWGNAIYYDDPRSGALADEMGVVLGTSHHEPMGRAHQEWNYLGSGAWDYEKNPKVLQEFWQGGMERMKDFETIVTVGMRGDGDAPMSEGANIALLQRIIQAQRNIIAKVTGKKAEERPQAWALYKEVQDYYDKGMRVPEDITLLLCDDNWGNVRKLPDPNAPKRKGGYGMYYHFDYVGGPRNYKWLNVTQNERTYEQMSLAFRHGVDRIWVVNVGDLKPMEFPISFFLDLAWNPNRFNPQNLPQWTEAWVKQQFGGYYPGEITRMLNLYTKYNSRVTPELLDEKTFSSDHYNEFENVLKDYKDLALDALRMYNLLPLPFRDAFDELVLFPINGMCNLYEMYYALALNKKYAATYDMRANAWADRVKECFLRDSLLTLHYNKDIAGGKWAHQMDQQRIGYTSWNNPPANILPKVEYVYRKEPTEKRFVESNGYISIEACHFARAKSHGGIRWEIIPNLGHTASGVTTFPQAAYPPSDAPVYLEYDIQTSFAGGDVSVQLLLAPTLNFNANKGLRYALSFDNGKEEIVNFNGHYDGSLGKWQGERIIRSITSMAIGRAGNHTLRIRVLEPGIVFEKILLDFGGLQPSYLGAPESAYANNHSPFPAIPPSAGATTRLDHDQMMEQLNQTYPSLPSSPPSSQAPPNPSPYHTAQSAFGLWTNYVQEWEPGGDYYTGAKFYKPLPLHDLTGLTAQTWPERRAVLFKEVQKIYGAIPNEAGRLKIEWTITDPVLVEEVYTREGLKPTIPFRQYRITGNIDTSTFPGLRHRPVLSGVLRIPASVPQGSRTPIVIHYAYSFDGSYVMSDESLWDTMATSDIGVLYFNAGALQPDNGEGLTDYLIGLVNRGAWRTPSDWGTLVAWSWGISRFIDFFEQNNTPVDAGQLALTGHSRYGKATLVAMAYDTRITTAFPSSSGAMGVAQSRRHWGEDLENCVWDSEYHWLAGNAMRYAGIDESSLDGYMPRKVMQLPVDAESLVALCAPRPLFIGSGESTRGDAWVDPYGQYLTAVSASPVYELLGKKGLVMNDVMTYEGKKIPMPTVNKSYLSGHIGYRRHQGGHEAGPNYPAFKEFMLMHRKHPFTP